MTEQPPQWPGNEEQETEHNPFWQSAALGDSNKQWQDAEPRYWYEAFRDILTMRDEVDCADILNGPTADYGHAYGRYAAVSGVIIVIVVALLGLLIAIAPDDAFDDTSPRSSTSTFGDTQSTEEDFNPEELLAVYCIGGPVSIVLNIVIYTIGLGIVHVIATTLFTGDGDFEKLVYGVFTLWTAYSAAAFVIVVPLLIVLFIGAAVLGADLFLLCFVIFGIAVMFYMYYLYTLIVKTVYSFGWGSAFMSAVVIPIGGVVFLYASCALCLTSGTAG